jgi:hypothetical protein
LKSSASFNAARDASAAAALAAASIADAYVASAVDASLPAAAAVLGPEPAAAVAAAVKRYYPHGAGLLMLLLPLLAVAAMRVRQQHSRGPGSRIRQRIAAQVRAVMTPLECHKKTRTTAGIKWCVVGSGSALLLS